MSNLLKGFYTKETTERVIDYNDIISLKIEEFKKHAKEEIKEVDGFVSGLDAATVENLIGNEGQIIGETQNPEDALLEEQQPSEIAKVSEEDTQVLCDNMLEEARQQSQRILEDAKKEAELIKQEAFDSGKAEGSEQGYKEGQEKAQEEYQVLINDANAELARLEAEYTTRYNSMESEIVDALLEVFTKVTYTISEDNKEIVLHLINQVMSNIESSGDYYIRVSKDDYPFIVENQGKIYNSTQKDINVNIVEDQSLTKSQCIIETDGGIFDCSLDIQLEQLSKDIRLLSCLQN